MRTPTPCEDDDLSYGFCVQGDGRGIMSSTGRAVVIAISAVAGVALGFFIGFSVMQWTGICPENRLCEMPIARFMLGIVLAPFVGMAGAYLALRGIERSAK